MASKTSRPQKKPKTKASKKPPAKPSVGKRRRSSERDWRIVNRQQLATLMGVHPDTVTHNAKEGMPVLEVGGRGKESQYNAVECLDWQRQRAGKNAKEAAQTRALTRSAELNELKLAQQRGELVPVDDVVREGQAFVLAWRAKVLTLARRMVQASAIPRESEAAATQVCLELLEDISSWKTMADSAAAAAALEQAS